MENNLETKINIPNGMKIDKVHSDLDKGIIKYIPEKLEKDTYWNDFLFFLPTNKVDFFNNIIKFPIQYPLSLKEVAYFKLSAIADYFNNGWKPFVDTYGCMPKEYYYIEIGNGGKIMPASTRYMRCGLIFFKERKDCEFAINLLTKEELYSLFDKTI